MVETIAKGPFNTLLESTNLVEVHESYIAIILGLLILAVITVSIAIELVRRKHSVELKRIAYEDPVTGFGNHAFLIKECNDLLRKNTGKRYALISADIDSFKSINNIFGIGYGNELLKSVAQGLSEALPYAVVTRDSADIFLVLVPFTTEDSLQQDVDKVVTLMSRIKYKDAASFTVSVSAGVYVIGRGDTDAHAIVNKANMARFSIKHSAHESINYFSEAMRAQMADEAILENDLKCALERNEFRLVYQPKVRLDNGITEGFEALLRWDHPVVGAIGPARFIPIAERTGLIVPISAWLIQQACLDIQQFQAHWLEYCELNPELFDFAKQQNIREAVISLNLSPNDLVNPTLIMSIQASMTQHNIIPGMLQIEITESAFFNNQELAIETINQLRGLGLSVALDDFGTGYSALGHLVHLPLHVVKLDRLFIQEIETDARSRQMVFSIISLVQSLGYSVVAEGAETQAHIDVLRDAGCDVVQGFFYSKPLPMDKGFEFYIAGLEAFKEAHQDVA